MKRGGTRRRLPSLPALGAFVLALGAASPALAQSICEPVTPSSRTSWGTPLDRPITMRTRGKSVRDAIEAIARFAKFRLSYSDDLLPSGTIECSFEQVPAGDALRAVLGAVALEPVVVGDDHVALRPRPEARRAQAPASAADSGSPQPTPVVPLERVLVVGERPRVSSAPPAIDVEVIDGRDLAARSTGSLAQALNGIVPGLWVWAPAAGAGPVEYASVRGASSFGASAPKIFIDGIEVANPQLLSRVALDAVERVEIIRGPQGAALYGADAIAGVIHIVTRPTLSSGPIRAALSSSVGAAASAFSDSPPIAHEHALGLGAQWDGGSGMLTLSAGSSAGAVGGASTKRFGADGSARWIGQRSVIGATLRFSADEAASPISPLVGDGTTGTVSSRIRQFTAGLTAQFAPTEAWTHEAVVGIDGYAIRGGSRMSAIRGGSGTSATGGDSGMSATGGGSGTNAIRGAANVYASGLWSGLPAEADGLRGTLRLTSAAPLDLGRTASGMLTLSLDHSLLRTMETTAAMASLEALASPQPVESIDRMTTGLSGRMDAVLLDRLKLSGGLRLEYAADGAGTARFAALPMLGAEWQVADGPVGVQLRAAYGTAIRWPALPLPARWPRSHGPLGGDAMGPEQQSGIEAGIDVSIGSMLRLEVTRFDQIASGLAAGEDADGGPAASIDATKAGTFPGAKPARGGAITNRGWELSAALHEGPLALTGALTLVDSRVRAIGSDYDGELRPGDRMLDVPARTLSLSAGWTGDRWSAAATASRAYDWIGYDDLALARAELDGGTPAGGELRDFWMRYSGNTRVRLSAMRELRPGLSLSIVADNLLNHQLGEPDNITILPGRTLSLGLKASF